MRALIITTAFFLSSQMAHASALEELKACVVQFETQSTWLYQKTPKFLLFFDRSLIFAIAGQIAEKSNLALVEANYPLNKANIHLVGNAIESCASRTQEFTKLSRSFFFFFGSLALLLFTVWLYFAVRIFSSRKQLAPQDKPVFK